MVNERINACQRRINRLCALLEIKGLSKSDRAEYTLMIQELVAEQYELKRKGE